MILIALLLSLFGTQAKVVQSIVLFNQSHQWRYISKYAADVGKSYYMVKAKILNYNETSTDYKEISANIYLDDNWNDVLNTEVCSEKHELSKRIKKLAVPYNGDWSKQVKVTLSQQQKPHLWYFALSDCNGDYDGNKLRIRFEVEVRDSSGNEFSKEDKGLVMFYPIATLIFGILLRTNLLGFITQLRNFSDIEEIQTFILNSGISCQILSLFFFSSHYFLYHFNGYGFVVFDFFGQCFEVISHVIITILLLLMSLGWTINYKELPDMELTLPLSIVVIMLNFIIVGLGRITEDSYYKFSDYEGIPGYILLIFRIGLWVWFAYNAYRLHENAKGPFIGFTMNFLLIGTIWFVALPVILFASWMFVEWERNKVVIFGSLLIQTIAFVLFNYIFSQKSSFYKISTIGESVLPGKIHQLTNKMEAQIFSEIDLPALAQQHDSFKHKLEEALNQTMKRYQFEGILGEEPVFTPNIANFVMLSNLPQAEEAKSNTLKTVLGKILARFECPIDPSKITLPIAGGKIVGCCFLEYDDEELAKVAVSKVNGFQLDKQHKLIASSFEEIERLSQVPDEYVSPNILSQQELQGWLLDQSGRDQFVIRFKDQTIVYWNNPIQNEPELVCSGPTESVWTQKYVHWSPMGTYLATLHNKGIGIWGGINFQDLQRFEHFNVSKISFSPCERFLLSVNDSEIGRRVSVWDLNTGEEKRRFTGEQSSWADFRWSFNGDYLLKKGKDKISIFQTSDMSMTTDQQGNKSSISVPQLENFSVSNSANLLAYYAKQYNQKPAQFKLIDIPTRRILQQKSQMSVFEINFHWQSQGQFLVAAIINSTKSATEAKPYSSNLEIFHLKSRNIPVETLSFNIIISNIYIEPFGNKIAVSFQSKKTKSVELYEVQGNQTKLLDVVEISTDNILWAPTGGHFVGYSYPKPGAEGKVEFYSIKQGSAYYIESISHSSLNFIEWDGSGRFLITASCQPLNQTKQAPIGSGYIIWNSNGRKICQMQDPHFYQVSWRPRPQNILALEQLDEIEKNIEEIRKEYRRADRETEKQMKKLAREQKYQQEASFNTVLKEGLRSWDIHQDARNAILGVTLEELNDRWYVDIKRDDNAIYKYHSIKRETIE